MRKSIKFKDDYPDLGHYMDDFKAKIKVAIEFQMILCNFKTLKRVDAIKTYFF